MGSYLNIKKKPLTQSIEQLNSVEDAGFWKTGGKIDNNGRGYLLKVVPNELHQASLSRLSVTFKREVI